MNQPSSVKQRQGRSHVAQVPARFLVRKRRKLVHVLPVQQLHRVVGHPAIQPVVVHLDDSGVLELRQRLILAFEQEARPTF